MGPLGDKLRVAQTVGIDSAIFIYQFEDHPRYKALCEKVFDLMEAGIIQAVTPTVTLIEVLVQPLSRGKQELYCPTLGGLKPSPSRRQLQQRLARPDTIGT
jgi:hypothetical protein